MLTDHDRPDGHEDKQGQVGDLLQREQERVQMVGEALAESVHGVESVAGKRRRHDPFVVGLVQVLVDPGVMQPAVDEVDAAVGERDEERVLQVCVERKGALLGEIVELGVPAHFGDEAQRGQNGHAGHGMHGLFDLQADLVAEEFGVLHGALVVYEIEG